MDTQEQNAPSRAMPRYQSHKKVYALKIAECVSTLPSGHAGFVLSFSEPGYGPKTVDATMMVRYLAKPGDYYVVYDDGYASISPQKPFEEGYTRL